MDSYQETFFGVFLGQLLVILRPASYGMGLDIYCVCICLLCLEFRVVLELYMYFGTCIL